MVSVEYDNCRFSAIFHCFHKISCKLVHLIDHVYIIFPFILLCFVIDTFYFDLRILNQLLLRVISMSLHTDGKYEILLLGRIHSFHNIVYQNLVLCPSIWRKLKNVHKFFTCKTVKSHMIIDFCTTVEVTSVIVQSMSTVSQC